MRNLTRDNLEPRKNPEIREAGLINFEFRGKWKVFDGPIFFLKHLLRRFGIRSESSFVVRFFFLTTSVKWHLLGFL